MEIEQGGRSAGTTGLRRPNDRRLFQLLRRLGEASKAELARRAQLTSTAVGTIIQALEQDGLVSPTGRRVEGQRGQPATLVSINPKGAFGIGVRLDRDAIESILVDLDGEIKLYVSGMGMVEFKIGRDSDVKGLQILLAQKLKDKVIFDGRNLYEPKSVASAGLTYHSIGRVTAQAER